MKWKWIAVICLTVILASILLMPMEDVYASAAIVYYMDVSEQERSPMGVAFSSNGKKMYVVGYGGTPYTGPVNVYEYACGTAFALSTCSFSTSLDIYTQGRQGQKINDVEFSGNGMILYVMYSGKAALGGLHMFQCLVPFSVATCWTSIGSFFYDNYTLGMTFSNNGHQMFLTSWFPGCISGGGCPGENAIEEFECGDAFDIRSCVSTGDRKYLTPGNKNPWAPEFSSNGKRLFVSDANNNLIQQYDCGSAFDVTSCSFTGSRNVNTWTKGPRGLALSNDGLSMFIVNGKQIDQYALHVPFELVSKPEPPKPAETTPPPPDADIPSGSTLSVETDRASYIYGDTIRISGNVGTLNDSPLVSVTMFMIDPIGETMRVGQVVPSKDGSFHSTLTGGRIMQISGDYTITAQYDLQKATTTFYFGTKTVSCGLYQVIVDGKCVYAFDIPSDIKDDVETDPDDPIKVTICHTTQAPDNYQTINVSESALQAHLDHGDTLGECSDISGQDSKETKVPGWIKNNAKWWAKGQINDDSFVQGLEWMIQEDVMRIPPTAQGHNAEDVKIPGWIKNNAKWWAGGQINDDSFVNGIQWLIENGIMRIR